jgi:hypothetical protein
MDKNKELLSETIKEGITNLSKLEDGSDAKRKAVDDVAKLYSLKIEEDRLAVEREDKEAQHKDLNRDRWINAGVQVGLAICGWLAYDIWYRRGLKFEETGTITSPQTRNLISKMLPKSR